MRACCKAARHSTARSVAMLSMGFCDPLSAYRSYLFSRRILFLKRFCFSRICLSLFLWLNFFIAASLVTRFLFH